MAERSGCASLAAEPLPFMVRGAGFCCGPLPSSCVLVSGRDGWVMLMGCPDISRFARQGENRYAKGEVHSLDNRRFQREETAQYGVGRAGFGHREVRFEVCFAGAVRA